jgi:hypothetical protein
MEPNGRPFLPPEFARQLVDFGHLSADQIIQPFAFRRQFHTTVLALQKRRPQLLFKSPNLIAHRWLRQTQLVCGGRQASTPAYLQQYAHPSQIDRSASHKKSFCHISKIICFTAEINPLLTKILE